MVFNAALFKKNVNEAPIILKIKKTGKGRTVFLESLSFLGVLATGAAGAVIVACAIKWIIENIQEEIPSLLFWMISYLPMFAVPVICLVWSKCIQKRTWIEIGFSSEGIWKNYGKGAIGGIALITVIILIGNLIGFFPNLQKAHSNLISILMMLAFWAVQGVAEEIVFRGYFLLSLIRKNGVLLSVVLCGVAFAAYHATNPGFSFSAGMSLFLFGILSSLLLIRCGNIWICSALHTFWNFTQNDLFGFHSEGVQMYPSVLTTDQNPNPLLGGGDYGLEGSALTAIILLISIVCLIRQMEREKRIQMG